MQRHHDTPAYNRPSLPVNHAFAVQFRYGTEAARDVVSGRVEHIASGQATRFESWEQLQQFIVRILSSVAEKPP